MKINLTLSLFLLLFYLSTQPQLAMGENFENDCPFIIESEAILYLSYATSILSDIVLLLTIYVIVSHSTLRSLNGFLTLTLAFSFLFLDILDCFIINICNPPLFLLIVMRWLSINCFIWMTLFGYQLVLSFYAMEYVQKPSSGGLALLSGIGFGLPIVITAIYSFLFIFSTEDRLPREAISIILFCFAIVNMVGYCLALLFSTYKLLTISSNHQKQKWWKFLIVYLRISAIFGIEWAIILCVNNSLELFYNVHSQSLVLSVHFVFNIQALIMCVGYLTSDFVKMELIYSHSKLSKLIPKIMGKGEENHLLSDEMKIFSMA